MGFSTKLVKKYVKKSYQKRKSKKILGRRDKTPKEIQQVEIFHGQDAAQSAGMSEITY